jgi:hypothetical protein
VEPVSDQHRVREGVTGRFGIGGGQVQAHVADPGTPRIRLGLPEAVRTDEPEQVMSAELVREAALEGVRDELPHSLAVVAP